MNILTATTRSGSTYTLTDSGQMTVTRKAPHTLPLRETFAVRSITRLSNGNGVQLRIVPSGTGAVTTTSRLTNATLPPCLRKAGGEWDRDVEVIARPTIPLRRPEVVNTWTPISLPNPTGLAAALAVYGD